MPELPEVETVARDLSPWLGAKLSHLKILDARVWFESEFKPSALDGRTVDALFRRGKYIVWSFNGLFLLQHLRMTGKVLPTGSSALPKIEPSNAQLRARFDFSESPSLFFYDTRRFGTLTGVKSLDKFWASKRLAPDPLLASDANLALAHFLKHALETSRPIKALLLDQTKISGVGNIYADEALFAQAIHPLTPANKIAEKKLGALFINIIAIFQSAITSRGTSAFNYLGVNGKPGEFAQFLKVYQRGEEKCSRCEKSRIEVITIAGRSSHFCPACQPRLTDKLTASDLRNNKTGAKKNARVVSK
jgi:formamidopyrimidine-DNA glycosylase